MECIANECIRSINVKSDCEIVTVETFMSDEHQKLIDYSFDMLKRYEECIANECIRSINTCYEEKEKALIVQKAIMNDKMREAMLSKIKDMYNVFAKTRIIIKPKK